MTDKDNFLVIVCDRMHLQKELNGKIDPKLWQVLTVTVSGGIATVIAQRIASMVKS